MIIAKPQAMLFVEKDPFIKIETIGRTCYKSTSPLTIETAQHFFEGLKRNKHTSVLEHANFVFEVDRNVYIGCYGYKYLNYTVVNDRYLISGNLRALNESRSIPLLKALAEEIHPLLVYQDVSLFDEVFNYFQRYSVKLVTDLTDLPNLTPEEFNTHSYYTYKFVCDRGVSHEIVRHRDASYTQESTRYCNYSQNKFGNQITVIEPSDWDKDSPEYFHWYSSMRSDEAEYFELLKDGAKPEQARRVLSNSLKTELYMTANRKSFDHFFDLRSRGTTGKPHPDMKVVADMALSQYPDTPFK